MRMNLIALFSSSRFLVNRMHIDMKVILNLSLASFILVNSLPLLIQEAAAAELSPVPLGEPSDSLKEDSKANLASEKKEKLDKIQQQMEQLTVLWQEMQLRKKQESIQQPTIQHKDVLTPLPEPVQQPARVPDPPTPNPPPAEIVPNKNTEAIPATSPNAPALPSPLTEPEQNLKRRSGPIHRFALSSSLFATGHHKECLHVLDSLDKSQWTPHESHWARFLEASCYRKLGQPEEAQRRYRRLVAESDSEWIGTLSRWWLDEIQDRKSLQKEIENLSTALKQWETEVNELARQNN